jgi:adenylate cyclase class IV
MYRREGLYYWHEAGSFPMQDSAFYFSKVSNAQQSERYKRKSLDANQKKDEKRIVVPALRRTSSGVSMEYKCIIIAEVKRKVTSTYP